MKITLYIDDKNGQVIKSTTEPWTLTPDHQLALTVPSPPMLVLKEEQQRFFNKAKTQQQGQHPVWQKLEKNKQ